MPEPLNVASVKNVETMARVDAKYTFAVLTRQDSGRTLLEKFEVQTEG